MPAMPSFRILSVRTGLPSVSWLTELRRSASATAGKPDKVNQEPEDEKAVAQEPPLFVEHRL